MTFSVNLCQQSISNMYVNTQTLELAVVLYLEIFSTLIHTIAGKNTEWICMATDTTATMA